MQGARVVEIPGNFDEALEIVRSASSQLGLTLVNSVNPYRIEGQKSVAWEVVDAFGAPPDYHFLPVGNAGNITAHWAGYRDYLEKGKCSGLPVMMGFQAAGAAPLLLLLAGGGEDHDGQGGDGDPRDGRGGWRGRGAH